MVGWVLCANHALYTTRTLHGSGWRVRRNPQAQDLSIYSTNRRVPIYLYDTPLVCVDEVLEHERRNPCAQWVVVQDRLQHHAAALAQRLG